MNFLAHIYLSGDNVLHSVGNYAGDFIKGRSLLDYPAEMRRGIIAHRAIDSFTDSHPAARSASKIFYPILGRYAGIVSDVVFDHFLSVNWQRYSHVELSQFIERVHTNLWNYRFLLPSRAQQLLASLIYQRYLAAYISYFGLCRVFNRMASRTSLPNRTDEVIVALKTHYRELDSLFSDLFNDLQAFADNGCK